MRIAATEPSGGGVSCDPGARFAREIDLFAGGDGTGVTSVDTTLTVPGPLPNLGCPLHGVGCPEHCPILRALDESDYGPELEEFAGRMRAGKP